MNDADLLRIEALEALAEHAARMRSGVEAGIRLKVFDVDVSAEIDRLVRVEGDLRELIAQRRRTEGRAA